MEKLLTGPDIKNMKVCNHHGDFDRQNNLASARIIIKENPEIDIYEIDFIDFQNKFTSSHDYVKQNIDNGSPLKSWIEEVCVKNKKILYVDLKVDVNLAYIFWWGSVEWKFDCRRLFKELEKLRKKHREKGFNICNYIWLTSQDFDVVKKLNSINRFDEKSRWKCIIDAPYVNYYILQYALPGCMLGLLCNRTYNDFMSYEFDSDIVALDYSFFNENIRTFIESSTIKRGSTIVLYSFELDTEPIEIHGYHIIMTYNYRRKKSII